MQDYGFRIYNPSIARFLRVDPLTKSYPFYTPYQFAGNNPIKFIDLDGAEPIEPKIKTNVAIIVVDAQLVKYETRAYYKNNQPDNWHVIVANNLADGGDQFTAYLGENSADNVFVFTHGSRQGQQITADIISESKRNTTLTSKAINQFRIAKEKNQKLKTFENETLNSILMEEKNNFDGLDKIVNGIRSNGNLVMTACWGGKCASEFEQNQLALSLHILAGKDINIYLNQDKTTINMNSGITNPTLKGRLDLFNERGLTTEEKFNAGWRKFDTSIDFGEPLKRNNGKSGRLRLNDNKDNPIKEMDKN